MRVLLVTNDYPPKPGGIQQYLGNLVRHFDGALRVLAPHDSVAVSDGQVHRHRRRFLWPTPAVRRWVEGHLAEFTPDVVVFGAPYPLAALGPGLERRRGVPFAVIAHGAEVVIPAAVPLLRQALLGPIRRAATVFAVSEFTARRVGRLTRREVRYLGAGVDLEAFHPGATSDRGVIGCVSRFVPRKGQARLLRAAAALRRSGREAEVLLVGKGRLEARLRRLATRLQVPTRFEVGVGWERLGELYREMDLFAMPARARWLGLEVEGLGIVYLEAAASGLPVVAGGSGGAPETVEPGVTGFVATSGAELREALELLLAEPARAREMGRRGRQRMKEHFTWEAVAGRFHAGLEEVIAGRR